MLSIRGLRTRLMVAYAVFFAIFLAGLALVFRTRLEETLDTQAQDTLNDEWVSLEGRYSAHRYGFGGGAVKRPEWR